MLQDFLQWLNPKVVRDTSNDRLEEPVFVTKKPKAEIYRDKKGEFRWRIVAVNGEIVGASCEGYSSRSGCENNLKAITNLRF